MSINKKVCIFNKNHIIGNQTIENHYVNCHPEEFLNIKKNGFFCRAKGIFFKTKSEMDKHLDNCSKCQLYLGKNQNKDKNNDGKKENSHDKNEDKNKDNTIDISIAGISMIKNKLPAPKKNIIKFPYFDFDKYKTGNKINNLDLEIINSLIKEEKNIII